MGAFWEGYLAKWRNGKTSLHDLLRREATPKASCKGCERKCLEEELAVIGRLFGGQRIWVINGDKLEEAYAKDRQKRCGEPAEPRKSPDCYVFRSGTEPPVCLIECKYRICACEPTQKKARQARSWRTVCAELDEATGKFVAAQGLLDAEGIARCGENFVVMNADIAPEIYAHWVAYLIENGKDPYAGVHCLRLLGTEGLREALEKLGVRFDANAI